MIKIFMLRLPIVKHKDYTCSFIIHAKKTKATNQSAYVP